MNHFGAIEENRRSWDRMVELHAASDFYDVPGFLAGNCTLDPIELEEVGPVSNLDMAHLQCHFGLDTLSWARQGARVTGVDFSPEAIHQARKLATQAGLSARFVESTIDEKLALEFPVAFDLVYTGGGALCWLPDLKLWATVIHKILRPGGRLYLREFHPLMTLFGEDSTPDAMTLKHPYFAAGGMMQFDDGLQYAVSGEGLAAITNEWPFSLSDVIQALLNAGFELKYFHEHSECSYRALPFLKERDGRFFCDSLPGGLPLMFSLMTQKRESFA